MFIFAATILVSAFLLFQVQPLMGKVILPWFGGSAAVWSAALLFFQVLLLAGYAYAHLIVRWFSQRTQMLVHVGLLTISGALLPILPDESWKPNTATDPTLRILLLLAVSVGLPYLLLSSTSPLVQAWYVRRTGTSAPYRLFALSNFGSMLGLLSFPFLIEPNLTSTQQALTWSGVYVVFAVLCAGAAWAGRKENRSRLVTDDPATTGRPNLAQLVLWIALAACGSALLLSITTHITQNVAPVPLLWVFPLAIYLLTFILAFESDAFYPRWIFMPLLVPALAFMAYLIYAHSGNPPIRLLVPAFCAGLFVTCMVCHGELARRRPDPAHLTLFYLMIAMGGAVGGVFVAIVAPRIFGAYFELPIALVACGVLAVIALWHVRLPKLGSQPLRWALVLAVAVLVGYIGRQHLESVRGQTLVARNFYGVLSVHYAPATEERPGLRSLVHGTINHGYELDSPEGPHTPTSYYGPTSGLSRALEVDDDGRRRIGVLGLGAGVTASLTREDDTLRYYEINPLVEQIARREFSFLRGSRARTEVLLGDARLVLERLPDERLDLLAMDAFTSDAVPVHLLTREAFALYARHVKRDGVIAINITNRYLDLRPVVAAAAQEMGWTGITVYDGGASKQYHEASDWVLLARSKSALPTDAGVPLVPELGFRGWTDDYSNVLRILR